MYYIINNIFVVIIYYIFLFYLLIKIMSRLFHFGELNRIKTASS